MKGCIRRRVVFEGDFYNFPIEMETFCTTIGYSKQLMSVWSE